MKEIISGLNTHTFTAYTVGTKSNSVIVRATEEVVKEVVKNRHLDIVLKDIFSGKSKVRTLPTDEYAIDLEDIEPFKDYPFGLFIPLKGGYIIPIEIVEVHPLGWRPNDPCISSYIPGKGVTVHDFIMNLRTREIIFLKSSSDSVTEIPNTSCPTVAGEAQPIFSMFITRLDACELMMLSKAQIPVGIAWYEKLGEKHDEDSTHFFSEGSSTGGKKFILENPNKLLNAYDEISRYLDCSSSNSITLYDDVSTYLTDEDSTYTYTAWRILRNAERSHDPYKSIQYTIRNTEAIILHVDKVHERLGYFRNDNGPLPSEAESPYISVTYKRRNRFAPAEGKDRPDLVDEFLRATKF